MPEILGVWFDDPLTMVNNALSDITGSINDAKNTVMNWITSVFDNLGAKIKGFFGGAFGWVRDLVFSAFRALFNAIKFW